MCSGNKLFCFKYTVLKVIFIDLFQETPIVVLTRTVPSKESHIDEEGNHRVDLAKLLGLHDVDTSAIKQKPDAFSSDVTDLSYELKFQSGVNTKKTSRGKKRVRRQRCYPPFWQCSIQPTSSKRKRVLPERHNMNL